jgi:hypothetical protein
MCVYYVWVCGVEQLNINRKNLEVVNTLHHVADLSVRQAISLGFGDLAQQREHIWEYGQLATHASSPRQVSLSTKYEGDELTKIHEAILAWVRVSVRDQDSYKAPRGGNKHVPRGESRVGLRGR